MFRGWRRLFIGNIWKHIRQLSDHQKLLSLIHPCLASFLTRLLENWVQLCIGNSAVTTRRTPLNYMQVHATSRCDNLSFIYSQSFCAYTRAMKQIKPGNFSAFFQIFILTLILTRTGTKKHLQTRIVCTCRMHVPVPAHIVYEWHPLILWAITHTLQRGGNKGGQIVIPLNCYPAFKQVSRNESLFICLELFFCLVAFL